MTAADRIATLTIPVPSRESAAAKSMRLLLEGRVEFESCIVAVPWVEVRGDSGRIHNVAYRHGRWTCSCEARGTGCSHMRACWLVVAESTS